MTKVKEMIQDLIIKLTSEATSEATHHGWCQTELKKAELSVNSSKADIEKNDAAIKQLEAALEKLSLEIADLKIHVDSLSTTREEMVNNRATEKSENEAAIDDAKQSAEAVEAALAVIEAYYQDAEKAMGLSLVRRSSSLNSKTNTKSSAAAVSTAKTNKTDSSWKIAGAANKVRASKTAQTAEPDITPETSESESVSGPLVDESRATLGMLEVVRDGYRDIESKTTQQEAAAAAAFTKELTDFDVMATASKSDLDYKIELNTTYSTELEQTSTDLEAAQQALSDATLAQEQLKGPCLTGETYEERTAKREAEIAALNEAYDMLVEYSKEMGFTTLLQWASRGSWSAGRLVAGRQLSPIAAKKSTSLASNISSSPSFPSSSTSSSAPSLSASPPSSAPTQKHGHAAKLPPPKNASFSPTNISHKVVMALTNATVSADDPLQEVTSLLSELKAEVQANLASDTKVYNDAKAWCDTAIAASKSAIEEADARDQELMTEIEVSVQGKAVLEVELKRLKEELAKEKQSLAQQQTFREKAAAEFHENEKEMLEAISALSHAIEVLRSRYGTVSDETNSSEEVVSQDSGTVEDGSSEPQLTGLMGVASRVKKALGLLPTQEANLLVSSAMSPILQEFFAHPESVFKRGEAASLAQVKSDLSPEGLQIYGILQQLLETFRTDLQAAQEKEETEKATHEDLILSKNAQVEALQNSISLKEQQYAKDTSTNANAKEELAALREARSAEYQRLLSLQEHCREVEAQFLERQKLRNEELTSLTEALQILAAESSAVTSGDQVAFRAKIAPPTTPAPPGVRTAVKLTTTVHPTPKPAPESIVERYLSMHQGTTPQKEHSSDAPRLSLVGRLAAPGTSPNPSKNNPPQDLPASFSAASSMSKLTRRPMPASFVHVTQEAITLARKVSKGQKENPNYSEVLSAGLRDMETIIESIRQTLLQEKEKEVQFKDRCVEEKHLAELQYARRSREEVALNAAIARLASTIQAADSQATELDSQVVQLNESLAEAATGRTEELENYETTVEEQKQQQAKLEKAIATLKAFYSLLQRRTSKDQAAATTTAVPTTTTLPGKFETKKAKHAGGSGILAILQLLLENCENMLRSLQDSEQAARDSYVLNIAETNKAIEETKRAAVGMAVTKTQAESDKETAEARLAAVQTEMAEIDAFLKIVEDRCGWIIQNFVASQAARQTQVDNLKQAELTLRTSLTTSM